MKLAESPTVPSETHHSLAGQPQGLDPLTHSLSTTQQNVSHTGLTSSSLSYRHVSWEREIQHQRCVLEQCWRRMRQLSGAACPCVICLLTNCWQSMVQAYTKINAPFGPEDQTGCRHHFKRLFAMTISQCLNWAEQLMETQVETLYFKTSECKQASILKEKEKHLRKMLENMELIAHFHK